MEYSWYPSKDQMVLNMDQMDRKMNHLVQRMDQMV